MLTPPEDLPAGIIAEAVGVDAATMVYRPVGFGSHHWSAGEWFVTVDDLQTKRLTVADSLDAAFERLTAALGAARGLACAVAPDGPVVRLGRYAAARYPFLDGESFGFGRHVPGEQRDATLDMLAEVHCAPFGDVPRDDFTIPHRDALEATLGGAIAEQGPYSVRAAALISDNARGIRRLLDSYDELTASADPARAVLTHGEPHTGNTMRTADGWKLIDWDTALIAPPERDLWLVAGDLRAYEMKVGTQVSPGLLKMYEMRWDLADLAVDLDRFRRPHAGNADDAETFEILQQVVRGVGTWV